MRELWSPQDALWTWRMEFNPPTDLFNVVVEFIARLPEYDPFKSFVPVPGQTGRFVVDVPGTLVTLDIETFEDRFINVWRIG